MLLTYFPGGARGEKKRQGNEERAGVIVNNVTLRASEITAELEESKDVEP
jgi:hypothetical protein